MLDVCELLADFLDDNINDFTIPPSTWAGWVGTDKIGEISIFIGPVRPESETIPANALFLTQYDGSSEKTFDNTYELIDTYVNMILRIKYGTDSRKSAFEVAAAIYLLVQKNELDDTLNMETTIQPVQLSYDEQNNALYSLNIAVKSQLDY